MMNSKKITICKGMVITHLEVQSRNLPEKTE
jgi:hypothetical protein